jgi:hypothetical protein
MALPILPDRMELVKKFAQEHGCHTQEHDEFYKITGVTRELLWIQRSPSSGGASDLEIASIETGDLAKAFKEIATSTHSWAVRFRDYAKKANCVDFAGPLPSPNENIVDWQEEKGRILPYLNGQPVPFAPGKTWIQLIPNLQKVTF